jgi:5-oxoprolinase (ATP-hydrolysing) subunit A
VKRLTIDLNSDVGESFGPYSLGNDEQLLTLITSANIACGFHAGDPTTIRNTLRFAAQNQVAVGAHPGYADRLHFGRVALPYSIEETVDLIVYQIGALQIMAETEGLSLQHVKLHGALYHLAATDRKLAEAFLDAIVRLKHALIVMGPPDCVLQKEAEDRGLDYAAEGFADRSYTDQGKLAPRQHPNSLITDPEEAAEQALSLARHHRVKTLSGAHLELKVDTICIHGDTPGATRLAKRVRHKLEEARIAIEPLTKVLIT